MRLPDPECKYGYTSQQLEKILGVLLPKFDKWMEGQTMCICDGRRYNVETRQYEPSECSVPHGTVVYPWDLERFLLKLPPLD